MRGNRYNRLFGENPLATELLEMIGADRDDFGRYRDVFIAPSGKDIVVYTRVGGANRPYFSKHIQHIMSLEAYVSDKDDEYDNTYAYFNFKVLDPFITKARLLVTKQSMDIDTIHNKFDQINVEMSTMSLDQMAKDPRFADDFKLLESAKNGGPIIRTFDDDMPEMLQV